MLRIHLTAADLAQARIAPRPVPLQELHSALLMLTRPRADTLLFARWRQQARAALPAASLPLGDLAPAGIAPAFLDSLAGTLQDAAAQMRATPAEHVAAELERAYAPLRSAARPPAWLRGLHRGESSAWRILAGAQRAAFTAVLDPVWPVVQDLHRQEVARYALAAAEQGVGAALSGLLPGARFRGSVWDLPSPLTGELRLRGRGLILLPTFQRTGGVLLADIPGQPLGISYPAGPGLPLTPAGADPRQALAEVLGHTRLQLLQLVTAASEHDSTPATALTTSALARRLGVSAATVSAQTAALRAAGLITTTRQGRSVRHDPTPRTLLLLGHPTPNHPSH